MVYTQTSCGCPPNQIAYSHHTSPMNMETAKSTPARRSQSAGVPRSPRVRRPSLPDSPSKSINRGSRSAATSPRPSIQRSPSATKPSSTSAPTNPDNKGGDRRHNNSPLPSTTRKVFTPICSPKNGNVTLSRQNPRTSSPQNLAIKRVVSTAGSPSAWALSPGRLSPMPPPSSLVARGSVGGVLRYFQKQKKASPEQEEGLHQYRLMYNRLLQWRFANANSERAITIVKRKAEEKLFAVWMRLCKMRNSAAEKHCRVQRLRLKIKLLEIACPQVLLLSQWEKLEKRNCEAVGRVARKLSAVSRKLPLLNGAKVDIVDLYKAMRSALEVMEDIEDAVTEFFFKAEETCHMLAAIINTIGEHKESFRELEKAIASIASLEVQEKSLRAQLMQTNKGLRDNHNTCKCYLSAGAKDVFNPLYFILNVS